MSISDTTESLSLNAPITHSAETCYDDGIDPGSCCAQWMPPASYRLYLKFVLAISLVFGGGSFGVYLLCEYLAR
ncbi:MAG: hypothetical protein VB032_08900 [Burkholderiaceae bacterium]|nr:hypothetical protein [Burkholderiaceae bacterium]